MAGATATNPEACLGAQQYALRAALFRGAGAADRQLALIQHRYPKFPWHLVVHEACEQSPSLFFPIDGQHRACRLLDALELAGPRNGRRPMSTVIHFTLTLKMTSDWHIGSGVGRQGAVDSLVIRDADRPALRTVLHGRGHVARRRRAARFGLDETAGAGSRGWDDGVVDIAVRKPAGVARESIRERWTCRKGARALPPDPGATCGSTRPCARRSAARRAPACGRHSPSSSQGCGSIRTARPR